MPSSAAWTKPSGTFANRLKLFTATLEGRFSSRDVSPDAAAPDNLEGPNGDERSVLRDEVPQGNAVAFNNQPEVRSTLPSTDASIKKLLIHDDHGTRRVKPRQNRGPQQKATAALGTIYHDDLEGVVDFCA